MLNVNELFQEERKSGGWRKHERITEDKNQNRNLTIFTEVIKMLNI